MRRVERLKQRLDLKIALRRTKNAIAKEVPLNDNRSPLEKQKNTIRTQLKRNLKAAYLKKSLRRADTDTDPCTHNGNQWYTFSNSNCYNQLDEVVVLGTRTEQKPTNLPSNFSNFMNKTDWWDGSIKDPWPNTKWDWFQNRVSGSPVWGTVGGTEDFGNPAGKNSVVGQSYYMDEWIIPGGGGGNLKFWGQLDNWAKYGLKGVQTMSGSIEQHHNVKSIFYKDSTYINSERVLRIKMDTMTIKIEEHYPYFKKYRGNTIPMINKRIYDTIINKFDENKVRRKKDIENMKSLENARKKFEKKRYIYPNHFL